MYKYYKSSIELSFNINHPKSKPYENLMAVKQIWVISQNAGDERERSRLS